MSDLFDNENETPSNDAPSFGDAFSEMESSLDSLPENGNFVTLRHESNAAMYVALNDGEQTITPRDATARRGLTLGQVNVYVDGNQITLDTPCAPGTVITLVGNVKGG